VWSWDITYLPSPVRGKFYYLYLIEDIYSRKAVGWEVYEAESGEKAAALLSPNGYSTAKIMPNCLR
jgi:putative transposase